MKRYICAAIAMLLVLMMVCGCASLDNVNTEGVSAEIDEKEIERAQAEPQPTETLEEDWPLDCHYTVEDSPGDEETDTPIFMGDILYPVTPYDGINTLIFERVFQEAEICREIASTDGYLEFYTDYKYEPRLTMNYSSFKWEGKVFSVLMEGTLTHPGSDEEIPRLFCMNFDIADQWLLSVEDVVYENQFAALALKCINALAESEAYTDVEIRDDLIPADAYYFENFLLTAEGLVVYFLPGEILDPSYGTIYIALDYSELDGILRPLGEIAG